MAIEVEGKVCKEIGERERERSIEGKKRSGVAGRVFTKEIAFPHTTVSICSLS